MTHPTLLPYSSLTNVFQHFWSQWHRWEGVWCFEWQLSDLPFPSLWETGAVCRVRTTRKWYKLFDVRCFWRKVHYKPFMCSSNSIPTRSTAIASEILHWTRRAIRSIKELFGSRFTFTLLAAQLSWSEIGRQVFVKSLVKQRSPWCIQRDLFSDVINDKANSRACFLVCSMEDVIQHFWYNGRCFACDHLIYRTDNLLADRCFDFAVIQVKIVNLRTRLGHG